MASHNKGVLGSLKKDGKEYPVVYIMWVSRDPMDRWYTTIEGTGERAVLEELADRRGHPVNSDLIQDAWTYRIVDENTFKRMAAGGLPIPPKSIMENASVSR
jgi:hypothetical protein